TLRVTVTASNTAPVAQDNSVTTDESTPVDITLVATDAEDDELTYTIISHPEQGTLSGTAPAIIYTPNAGYNGQDSFTFSANDSSSDSNTATVSITVNPVDDGDDDNGGSHYFGGGGHSRYIYIIEENKTEKNTTATCSLTTEIPDTAYIGQIIIIEGCISNPQTDTVELLIDSIYLKAEDNIMVKSYQLDENDRFKIEYKVDLTEGKHTVEITHDGKTIESKEMTAVLHKQIEPKAEEPAQTTQTAPEVKKASVITGLLIAINNNANLILYLIILAIILAVYIKRKELRPIVAAQYDKHYRGHPIKPMLTAQYSKLKYKKEAFVAALAAGYHNLIPKKQTTEPAITDAESGIEQDIESDMAQPASLNINNQPEYENTYSESYSDINQELEDMMKEIDALNEKLEASV
ncbi:MAG: Ig-like domain-containing protein, partial [Patescibacteria group bacterium]|nr:Ig-like domain-containing protein [Patescibacteria group bacterium]